MKDRPRPARPPERPSERPSRPAERPSAPPARPNEPASARAPEGWNHVASWYDNLLETGRNDLFDEVIAPGTLELLEPLKGKRVLDVACGQGRLAARLVDAGATVVGLDAARELVAFARRRVPSATFVDGDARRLSAELARAGVRDQFDATTIVMALMNIDPLGAMLSDMRASLKPGGVVVAVLLHPAFRSPVHSVWGWDTSPSGKPRQYRRIDAYATPTRSAIVMNPGDVARGMRPITTDTFHRPLSTYVRAFAEAGLLIDRVDEWTSHRRSTSGPRAAEENRSRAEIPMFAAIRARRAG
jgi:SAM-dependent methyltransferase